MDGHLGTRPGEQRRQGSMFRRKSTSIPTAEANSSVVIASTPAVVGPPAAVSVKRHTNPDGAPGGWVASTATVEAGAWVGARATVTGHAFVANDCRLDGSAVVTDDAEVRAGAVVRDGAHVGGRASVHGAKIDGNARVSGSAHVAEGAYVSGNARVQGDARITGSAVVDGDALVTERAWVRGGRVTGAANVAGTHIIEDGMHVDGSAGYQSEDRSGAGFGGLDALPQPRAVRANPPPMVRRKPVLSI